MDTKPKGFLNLERNIGESVMIGDDIEVRVVTKGNGGMVLGIRAPKHIPVHRLEIYRAIKRDGEKRKQRNAANEGQ